MQNNFDRRVLLAIGLLFPIGATGCGGCEPVTVPEPGACDSSTLENRIEAGAVGQAAGIAHYRYVADLDATVMRVDVIADDGSEAAMSVEQVFGDDDIADGTMRVTLGNAAMTTRGGHTLEGDRRIDMVVTRGEDEMHVTAEFDARPCFPAGAGPHCSGALDLAQAHVLLPSCGLDFDDNVRGGVAPVLSALNYAVPNDTVAANLGTRVVDGRRFVVVEVVREGVPRPDADVTADIDAAGGAMSSVIGDADVQLLASAYLDQQWRRTLSLHAATCISDGAFDITPSAAQTGAVTSGSNSSRDASSWGDGDNTGGAGFWGDPHMTTFDDVGYDFQAAGDFLLARSTGADLEPLEVQSRFAPPNSSLPICRQVTLGVATAVTYAGHTYEAGGGELIVDGAAIDASTLPDEAATDGGALVVTTADGTTIRVNQSGSRVRILPSDARHGTFVGLLGDADGDKDNDFRVGAGGDTLLRPVVFDVLYGTFRDAWRLDAESSHFTYAAGEGPDDFYDVNIPTEQARLDLIADDIRAPAEATCRARGLTAQRALFDCVLDVICIGPSSPSPNDAGSDVVDAAGVTLRGDIVLTPRPVDFDASAPAQDPSVTTCAFPERPGMQLFDEGERELATALSVGLFGPGTVDNDATPTGGAIAAGTTVHSYLVHLAPDDGGDLATAQLRFGAPVLGVQYADSALADARFVADGQTVADVASRGLDLPSGSEIEAQEDARTVELRLQRGSTAEQVRVVVEVMP